MNTVILFLVFLSLSTLGQSYENLRSDPNHHTFINGNSTLRRIKRQSQACKGDRSKFQCETNPDCIDVDQQCDGKEDCPDGSDEKQSLCQTITCPGYLFQCEYGACIGGHQKCDGVKDCKDNSDEIGCPSAFEKVNTNCRSDQFECGNGQCIETDNACNGIADCEDKSDETEELCLNLECPGYTYKCRYGACVDGTAKCNGVQECFDNSDEDDITCSTRTPVPPVITKPPKEGDKTKCKTPDQPANGNWLYFQDESKPPLANKLVPPKSQIIFRCNEMFKLSTEGHDRAEEIIYCREDGQWSFTVFPHCKKLCPKYHNRNHAILQCKLDGSIIPCDKATHGTQLTYKCDPYYEPENEYSKINVCRDGTWSFQEPRCVEVCGEKQVSAQTLVVNGYVVKRGNYPWVVALYSNKGNDLPSIFTNICGGSLLTTSIVLTAAHCVTKQDTGTPYAIKFYRVAAGKYYNKYMDERDNDTAQYIKVKKIIKHEDYRGQQQNFRSDIALLKLEAAFALSKVVQPVCFNKLPSLQNSGSATITGWGYVTMSGQPSDVLNEIDLEYVDNEKCHTELDPDFANQYLVSDKLCAGFINKSMGVCKGDSGGGLVIKNNNQRYFVQGIVSLAPSFVGNNKAHCDIQKRALFTRVGKYLDWIQVTVQLI